MYKIIRYGKRFNTKNFQTYEEARTYVRRWIRRKEQVSGNPALADYNFSIQSF